MDFLVTPWKHQLKTIRATKDRDYYGLFFEQGTGKTMTLINMLRVKYSKHQRILRTLILTPRIVVPNWVREFELHSRIESDMVVPLLGAGKNRAKMFERKALPGVYKKPRIFITNYEALLMKDLYALFQKWQIEALVLDESHKVKSMQSKRTKLAIKLSEGVKYRYIATGTPMPNGPMDIFSQFRILDQGESFGKNYFAWRAKFFYDKNGAWVGKPNHFPDWELRSDKLQTMNSKIEKSTARIKKEDCLDLPPLVRQKAFVEMGQSCIDRVASI